MRAIGWHARRRCAPPSPAEGGIGVRGACRRSTFGKSDGHESPVLSNRNPCPHRERGRDRQTVVQMLMVLLHGPIDELPPGFPARAIAAIDPVDAVRVRQRPLDPLPGQRGQPNVRIQMHNPIISPQIGQPVVDRPRLGERVSLVVHQIGHPALHAQMPAKLPSGFIILPGDDDEVIEVPQVVRQRLRQKSA